MPNSIRTPKSGKTAYSRRVAQAVDNEDWQKFRLSMKGKPTETKLEMLQKYWTDKHNSHTGRLFYDSAMHFADWMNCPFCVRVDNYIKALCRGGQLCPRESLDTVLNQDWHPNIVK